MKTHHIKDQKVEIIPRADHCALILKCTYEVTDLRRKETKIKVRQVYNEKIFKNLIVAHDWSFYFSIDNPEEAARYLVDTSVKYQEESRHEIKCSKMRRKKLKPWMSYGLLAKMRRKLNNLQSNLTFNKLRKACRLQKYSYYNLNYVRRIHVNNGN